MWHLARYGLTSHTKKPSTVTNRRGLFHLVKLRLSLISIVIISDILIMSIQAAKEGIAAHWAVVPSLFFSLFMIYYYALPTSELWYGEEGCQMPGNSFLCFDYIICII
ncbi:hypothetical protein NZ47_02680 [Anaerovibrio lipolyticus]|uniref:Uncharacterized protein n=1 Tax=Anaerovibrio lipolyticus TaxID=82374 RepID=A0A0B2K3X0_9FIRM|nr:hypothetical protein NZ47_02680 [Anaerovibrio lipolyticus]